MTTFVAVKVEHVAGSDLFLGFALFDGESAALSGGQLRITARKPVFYFPNVRLVQPIRFIDELVYFQLLVRRVVVARIQTLIFNYCDRQFAEPVSVSILPRNGYRLETFDFG